MKIDFSQKLLSLRGEDIPINESGDELLTLGYACAEALSRQPPANKQILSGIESAKRGRLAMKVVKGGKIDIELEEATLMRDCAPLAWQPILVAQIFDMLDKKD